MRTHDDPVPPPEVAVDVGELDVDDDPGDDGDDTNAESQRP